MVLFSYDIFTAQPTGGVSRCMIELMSALTPTGTDWRLWTGSRDNALLQAALSNPAFAARTQLQPARKSRGRFFAAMTNEPGFAKAVSSTGAAVVHRTYYPFVDLVSRRAIRVETLHDMWDERDGKRRGLLDRGKSALKRRALSQADVVICVSHSTRMALEEIWPDLSGKTRVIHHGVRRLSAHPRQIARTRPYFLFVGRRGFYKNFNVVLDALRISSLNNYDLVAFGGGGLDATERAAISAAGLTGRVFQGEGGDDQLAGLYESAAALLYPSAYEGFGLPLLEAMIHGCPVIASPLTSLPEVGGDAVLYADPGQPVAWAETMATLVGDDERAERMRSLGSARAALFSWERSATSHAALYRDVGGLVVS